jgi:hypothetical protein
MLIFKNVPHSGFEPENLDRNELYSVGFPVIQGAFAAIGLRLFLLSYINIRTIL